MPDGARSGIDFGSRLLSNIYGLHKQEQDRERDEAGKQRESMLSILTAAANSGNVNPDDMPVLIRTLFETASTKPDKKAIDALTEQVSGLFSKSNTPRKVAGPLTPPKTHVLPGGNALVPNAQGTLVVPEVPSQETTTFTTSGGPTEATVNTPAVRWMSPDERAAIEARAAAKKAEALWPQRERELRTTYGLKSEQQMVAIRERAAANLDAIRARGDEKARAVFTQRYQANLAQSMDEVDAQAEAAQFVKSQMDAGLYVKQSQGAVNDARVKQITESVKIARERLADTKVRTGLMAQRTGAYINRMQQLAATGAAEKSQLPVYNAMIRDLLPERTALQRKIISLKADPDVRDDEETQVLIAEFEDRITEIDAEVDAAKIRFLPTLGDTKAEKYDPVGSAVRGAMQPSGTQPDGKYHYTPDQIRRALKPGQSYDEVLRKLQARPDVVIDQ